MATAATTFNPTNQLTSRTSNSISTTVDQQQNVLDQIKSNIESNSKLNQFIDNSNNDDDDANEDDDDDEDDEKSELENQPLVSFENDLLKQLKRTNNQEQRVNFDQTIKNSIESNDVVNDEVKVYTDEGGEAKTDGQFDDDKDVIVDSDDSIVDILNTDSIPSNPPKAPQITTTASTASSNETNSILSFNQHSQYPFFPYVHPFYNHIPLGFLNTNNNINNNTNDLKPHFNPNLNLTTNDNTDINNNNGGANNSGDQSQNTSTATIFNPLLINNNNTTQPRWPTDPSCHINSTSAAANINDQLFHPFAFPSIFPNGFNGSFIPTTLSADGAWQHPQPYPLNTLESFKSWNIIHEIKPKRPHIKKPLNAFMLFMKEQRNNVVTECTLKESAAINQILGRKWHELSREEQSKYYEMARQERLKHMEQYPNWSARDNYGLRKKRRKKREKIISESGAVELARKCRARYGLNQIELWCKPCRRKKKCTRFQTSDDNFSGDSETNSQIDPLSPVMSACDAESTMNALNRSSLQIQKSITEIASNVVDRNTFNKTNDELRLDLKQE